MDEWNEWSEFVFSVAISEWIRKRREKEKEKETKKKRKELKI